MNKEEIEYKKQHLRNSLPHLYGFKHYAWSRKFYESKNKNNFLVAANQISKSSTLIRKNIHWATETTLWKELWPLRRPFQFWYFYPTKDVMEIEVLKKWVPEFLPKGDARLSGKYSWELDSDKGEPKAIHFGSGVSVYFKSYKQGAEALQTGTVDMISFDEELPEHLWDELSQRRSATDGYVNGVFTATLGQEFWRQVMEVRGEGERFPDALKLQVSKFDCLKYEDGSSTPWTLERIQKEIAQCKSPAEVQRRIYGKFVKESGLKYGQFEVEKHVKKRTLVPKDWLFFEGIDIGGGGDGHPPAIAVIAVSPDFKRGRIVRGWKGQGELTASSDIYAKHLEITKHIPLAGKAYDWAAKEFYILSTRLGESFQKADKSHAADPLNTLFKNGMLTVDDIPELAPLVAELTTLQISTPKNKAKDDFVDALRYGAGLIPWDYSDIREALQEKIEDDPGREIGVDELRNVIHSDHKDGYDTIEDELDAWNELYEVEL